MKYASDFYKQINTTPSRLQKFIDTFFADKYNDIAWKKSFAWDVEPSLGGAFEQADIIRQVNAMADGRVKWSETSKRDTDGISTHLGTVFNFGVGKEETGEDIERINKIAENWGGDKEVVKQFVVEFDNLISGVHNRITNMAMQMESTGGIIVDPTYSGVGFKLSPVPFQAGNKLKTVNGKGWAASASASATPITDMLAAEKRADAIGMPANRVWRLPIELQAAFLANPEVKSYIKMMLYPTTTNIVADMVFSADDLANFVSRYRRISPIEWVDSIQYGYKRTGELIEANGWASGVAILRPAGFAGVVKYDEIPEVKIQAGQPNITTAYAEGGRIGIIRKFEPMKPLWTTDVLASAAPILNNWSKYITLDTTA